MWVPGVTPWKLHQRNAAYCGTRLQEPGDSSPGFPCMAATDRQLCRR